MTCSKESSNSARELAQWNPPASPPSPTRCSTFQISSAQKKKQQFSKRKGQTPIHTYGRIHYFHPIGTRVFHSLTASSSSSSPRKQIPANRWVTLRHRRLQTIPAQLTTATNTLVSSTPLPDWLVKPVVERIHGLDLFSDAPHGINHCLINEYLPGQGIMPHEDGAAYHPVVATVSLCGTLVLDVTEKKKRQKCEDGGDDETRPTSWRIVQEPRSLLVTTGQAYTQTLHGIAEVSEDVGLNGDTVANWKLLGNPTIIEANGGKNLRSTRISLTYRDVKKVSKLGSKIFGKPRT